MMITKLEIQNFKGIKNCNLENLGLINLIIGKNDASKSSLLESIYIQHILTNQPDHLRDLFHRRSLRDKLDCRALWSEYNTNNEIKISSTINNKPINFILKWNNVTGLIAEVYVDGTRIEIGGWTKELNQQGLSNYVLERVNKELHKFFSGISVIDTSQKSKFREVEETHLGDLTQDGRDSEVLDYVSKIYFNYPKIGFVPHLGTGERRFSITPKRRPIAIDDFGDGIRQGISIISTLLNSKNTVVLIEELENHQHPQSLRNLIKSIVEIAQSNLIQLFVTTHNPDTLRYFIEFFPDIKVFHVKRNNETGSMDLIESQGSLFNIFRDVGWDVGNILKYQKFLIVESVNDGYIISELFKKYSGENLENYNLAIVPARGVDKIKDLVKSFSHLERKCFVIRDLDSMKPEDCIQYVVDSLKSLQSEGYEDKSENEKIILVHPSGSKIEFKKSYIFPLGNIEKFQNHPRHTIDDYLLEFLLEDEGAQEKLGVKGILKDSNSTSKEILVSTFGFYNYEIISKIVEILPKEKIHKDLIKIFEMLKES